MRCSKRLKAALDRLGTPCVLHVSPGEIHGYDAMVWRPEARAKWRAVYAFLEEHLKPARSNEAHAHGARATG
jgi:dipeptidyl aminopeptidase/acylaminoacyl peptidase